MTYFSIERITSIDEKVTEAAQRLAIQLDSSNQVSLSKEYLLKVTQNPDHYWLMARRTSDGTFIGMASLFVMRMPTNVRSFLENVAVDESERGRGVGSALIANARTIADEQGANTLRAQAGIRNDASRAMLQKSGFTVQNYLDYYELDIQSGPRF